MNGPSVSYRCRSEPHRPLEVIRTIASLGAWMTGSGTVSTRTSLLPCHVTACMLLTPRIGEGRQPPDLVRGVPDYCGCMRVVTGQRRRVTETSAGFTSTM